MSAKDAKVLKTEPLKEETAAWTKLILTTYTDPLGKQRTSEHAERRTRPKGSDIDGVGIVAILEKPTGPELVLQKQYRPPIDKVMIEVPAGLVDAGESAEQAAVRELKEETGYVGVVSESSPIMFNGTSAHLLSDPGFCNTNTRMVHVTVDMANPANQVLKPELEENEFIEVFTLPLKDMWKGIAKLEKEGYGIDARVGTLAEGIEIAQRWKL
ncbi:ADP-ribose pyrophosphatase [Lachnellula suecica]|uniref:ADP-ribose pyrophosphatase n=1 Tax=Lachnellula suecica TaxID=602035 RepID=A0A8T9BTU1_9HELO|nr:ADP-ribose pyrophosphatase [Lachnellula suecica]